MAARTDKGARLLFKIEGMCAAHFSALAPQYAVLLGSEQGFPLGVGLDEFLHGHGHSLAAELIHPDLRALRCWCGAIDLY